MCTLCCHSVSCGERHRGAHNGRPVKHGNPEPMPSDCQPIVASHLGRNRKAYLLLLKIDFPLQILAALSQCLDPGGRPRLSEDAFLADALLGQEVNDPGEDQWHLKNKFQQPIRSKAQISTRCDHWQDYAAHCTALAGPHHAMPRERHIAARRQHLMPAHLGAFHQRLVLEEVPGHQRLQVHPERLGLRACGGSRFAHVQPDAWSG